MAFITVMLILVAAGSNYTWNVEIGGLTPEQVGMLKKFHPKLESSVMMGSHSVVINMGSAKSNAAVPPLAKGVVPFLNLLDDWGFFSIAGQGQNPPATDRFYYWVMSNDTEPMDGYIPDPHINSSINDQ